MFWTQGSTVLNPSEKEVDVSKQHEKNQCVCNIENRRHHTRWEVRDGQGATAKAGRPISRLSWWPRKDRMVVSCNGRDEDEKEKVDGLGRHSRGKTGRTYWQAEYGDKGKEELKVFLRLRRTNQEHPLGWGGPTRSTFRGLLQKDIRSEWTDRKHRGKQLLKAAVLELWASRCWEGPWDSLRRSRRSNLCSW